MENPRKDGTVRLSLKLGRILGFPVEVDWTWFVVFILVTAATRAGLLQRLPAQDYSSVVLLMAGAVGSLLFFSSLLAHELAHCWVARQLGIPISGITLFIFGGVARMKGEPSSSADELRMSLAGPVVSIFVGGFFYLLWGTQRLPDLWAELAWYLAVGNALVALFNLVPAFPMDGGRALRAVIWSWTGNLQTATRIASGMGQTFGWLLVFYGVMQFITGDFGGVWFALIGLFLQNAAQSAYQQVQWQKAMQGLIVRDLMNREPRTVPPDVPVEQAVYDFFLREPTDAVPVTLDGEVLGVLHVSDLRGLPREQWAATLVKDVMRPVNPDCLVVPSADAWDVLTGMGQDTTAPLLVVEEGKLAGTLTQEELAKQIRLRMQLKA